MSSNRDLLERAVTVYNAGDLDAYVDLYADDAVLTTPEGVFRGRREIHERFARELSAMSDVTFTVVSYVEEGDRFADEFIFAGIHTGPFLMPDGAQLPATGRTIELKAMEVVVVRDGKMVVDNLYYDNASVLTRLGAVPTLGGSALPS